MKIEVNQVSKTYPKGVKALDGVSLSLEAGVYGLLGPNGAGKTTLIHLLAGLIRPASGEIRADGRPLEQQRAAYLGRLGYLPQSFNPYPSLSAAEFLDYLALLKGIDRAGERRREVARVLEVVNLERQANRAAGGFSGGMKRRLGIAQALLGSPQLLLLDEPTAGLDPEERLRFRSLLASLAFGSTVLVSSHIISDLAACAEELVVLEQGRLLFCGRPEDLRVQARGRVWEVSCGQGEAAALEKAGRLIHTRKEGGRITARVAAAQMPAGGARLVEPELEDAYITVREEVRR